MAKFPSDEYGKTALWRLRGNSIYTLPRSNVFVYILQSFPDVFGDQRGWRDTSISLEVCKCLQYIPVVVLTQQPRNGSQEEKNRAGGLHHILNYSPLAFAQGQLQPRALVCPTPACSVSRSCLLAGLPETSDPTQPIPRTLT